MSYFRDNIESLKGYQPGFQPKAGDVVKLNTNESPYPPSPKVAEALANLGDERLRRYPDPLGDEFRRVAADVNGLGVENIMCCNGGDDLLTIAFRSFCDERRPVAYPVPTYSLYPVLAKIQDCLVIEVPFEANFTLPDNLGGTGAALTIICNPNAPSGSFVEIDRIASLAEELSGVLLVDEAYVDYAEADCVELVRQFDNVVILRSMSKGYSLAGLRFGYAMAQAEMINGLMKVKDSYNVDAVAIAVAAAAMSDREYFAECVEKVKAERERMTEELRKLGFDVPASRTNFVLARCTNARAVEVYETLAERNIYVRYFPYPGLADKLRITIGTAEQNDKLLAVLKDILED
ncbi:MAG: histidinol-phosphate transaminase [Planctomycetota bacterium]|jgi:histidinol-phosphate aminotransferase